MCIKNPIACFLEFTKRSNKNNPGYEFLHTFDKYLPNIPKKYIINLKPSGRSYITCLLGYVVMWWYVYLQGRPSGLKLTSATSGL